MKTSSAEKKNIFIFSAVVLNILTVFCFLIIFELPLVAGEKEEFEYFITVKNDRLMDGNKVFRFISFNVPNLLTVEDNLPFTETNPWRLPNKFEIEDALKTIWQLGGQVARTYVITVRREGESEEIPRFVLGPGKFNESAFQTLDKILALANQYGIRLLIPLVDNWKWMGGKTQYAAFRGKKPAKFWTDEQIKSDFRKTLEFILNRKNTITGIPYKEDKAVLAWELGNELRDVPMDWINEMAQYIKSIDPNHLVNDGVQSHFLRQEVIESPYIDILSTHHYEPNPIEMIDHIRQAAQKAKGKKPFYIGEFGFVTPGGLEEVVNNIIETENISGALLWSLRFHNQDGGFYWHSEFFGRELFKAYHFPGFDSGKLYGEQETIKLIQTKASEIVGKNNSQLSIPEPPNLLPFNDVAYISWQGSVGTSSYIIERSQKSTGPWNIIAENISDAAVAYRPIFSDESVEIGKKYFYRVRAKNCKGVSNPSNVVGLVEVKHCILIDEMENFMRMYYFSDGLQLEYKNARDFKEDFHRIKGEKGAYIIYYTSYPLRDIRVFVFSNLGKDCLKLTGSRDGTDFIPLLINQESFVISTADYNYYEPILIDINDIQDEIYYLKIEFLKPSQISRVEIEYGY